MEFSSLHTHTLFCDGSDDVQTMCLAAYEKGLCSIGFSAHAPIYKKTGIKTQWHLNDEDLDEYIREIRSARERWKGKLPVFLGLEADYIKGRCGPGDSDLQSLGLDFIIGSVHYLVPDNGTDLFTVDGSMEEMEQGVRLGYGGDGEAAMHAYWDTVAEMAAAGGFEILGHSDIIIKNNKNNRWFDTDSEVWRCCLADISDVLSRSACVVEVNTGGLNRGKIDTTYPSVNFLRVLHEKNIPVLISSDAHRACDLDGHYDIARQTLRAAGYCKHVLFEGKTAGKPVWRNTQL